MKKRSCLGWAVGAGVLAVVLLCIAGIAAFYLQRRSVTFNSRPLVLIHAPINHDRVAVGEGIRVHATAREDSGLRRIELWVDDQLLTAREAPEDGANTLTLSHAWNAGSPGMHVIVVRALSMHGMPGQSTVTVMASTPSDAGPETHTLQEGETVDVIARDHGVSPEDLAASNPNLGSAGPGDELIIPDDDSGAAAGPVPGDAGEAPADSTASPGSSNPFESLLFQLVPFLSTTQLPSEPTSVRVEVLSLVTSQAFDGLHCYVGLGGATPRWLPDEDGDQTTDESFPALPGGGWDVQPSMAGAAAPLLSWPGNEILQLDISCVGVSGGGADAFELGRIQIGIPPADWDGTSRHVGSDGEGGQVDIEYKVTRMGGTPRGEPVWLEPGMTAPTNVHLDDRRISLRWDYNPRPDEEPIDGFRIYLNGSLQWTEPADARESGMPYEWFHPLCGSPYTFGVTAFRAGYPDGPESPAGTAIVATPMGECNREIQIIFHSLETFELGDDGSPDHVAGDVGPVFGYLYANEDEVNFNTLSSGEGGSLDMPIGLSDNTLYQLNDLFTNPDWNFSMMPGTVVDVPPGGSFEFGFYILDQDRTDDDSLCWADSQIYDDNPATRQLDEWHEGTLTSENGKCRLSFSWGPAMGSPVGSGVAGGEPLPWLELEDATVDAATGAVQLLLRNTGTATWPWKDLDVELRTRQGDTILLRTWDNFALGVGQERTLDFPPGTATAPFDVCVMLDPGNKVLELYERSGVLSHGPQCQQLPDLSISGVAYDGSDKLRVTVENVGDGTLENRTIKLKVYGTSTLNGTTEQQSQEWPGITLGPGQARALDLDGFVRIRPFLGDGYTVQLDPDGTLAESSVANNLHAVGPESPYLQLYLAFVQAPYETRRDVEFTVNADAVSGEYRRAIASWHIGQHIDWSTCFEPTYCNLEFTDFQYFQPHFRLAGDELLQITITASDAESDGGDVVGVETYGHREDWGAGPSGPTRSCNQMGLDYNPGLHQWIMGYAEGDPWYVRYHICREGP